MSTHQASLSSSHKSGALWKVKDKMDLGEAWDCTGNPEMYSFPISWLSCLCSLPLLCGWGTSGSCTHDCGMGHLEPRVEQGKEEVSCPVYSQRAGGSHL